MYKILPTFYNTKRGRGCSSLNCRVAVLTAFKLHVHAVSVGISKEGPVLIVCYAGMWIVNFSLHIEVVSITSPMLN